MKTKIVSAERVMAFSIEALPVGEYPGFWGGYEATFKVHGGATIKVKTETGVRGMLMPCKLVVDENGAHIKS